MFYQDKNLHHASPALAPAFRMPLAPCPLPPFTSPSSEILKMPSPPCHVVHFIYRLATGGLENVVVQLINHLPATLFRHTVIALTEVDPDFARRIHSPSVDIIALKKPPGQPFALYPRVYGLLRQLQPDVFHTCNLAALEFMPVAALARVPLRVHAEHGLDTAELGNKAAIYLRLRKLYNPFVSRYVTVSIPLQSYLQDKVGVAPQRLSLVSNGVDTAQFRPVQPGDALPADYPFQPGRDWVVGTVGRQIEIKNPLLLVDAFVALVRSGVQGSCRLRLAMVGDGPLRSAIAERMHAAGMQDRLWLPGVRSDVAEVLRALDCFVLPSLSEATSCTLQEAMATGLPIVVTDVGGNADLLEHGACGSLVPSGDVQAMAAEMLRHFQGGPHQAQAMAALAAARTHHAIGTTVQRYQDLFLGRMLRNSVQP